MHFVTNLFPVLGVQNLSKLVNTCQSYRQKLAATYMPHSVLPLLLYVSDKED